MSMKVDCSLISGKFNRIAVATSGGKDSMALLHYLNANKDILKINLLAINVEHGIRGEASINDSKFVKDYCDKNSIPLLSYSVNSLKYSKDNKLSIEEGARALRYQCFEKAKEENLYDFLVTAHHSLDNVETVLFNLFRGSGLAGLSGIPNQKGYIVRPLLCTTKDEIEAYINANFIPYVTDESNLSSDYTRNFIRLNIMPLIKEIFPNVEQSVNRLSQTTRVENEFLDKLAHNSLAIFEDRIELPIDTPEVLLRRAVIIALKSLGVAKDWEKVHVDDAVNLTKKQNGAQISLPHNLTLYREYDRLVFEKTPILEKKQLPFYVGHFTLNQKKFIIEEVVAPTDLKNGLFFDFDKVPKDAIIRTINDSDTFTKFGGGTKSLGDYFTDKKIPVRLRERIPIIAKDNEVYAIFGLAISNKVKIDKDTKRVCKLTSEEN